MDKILLILYGSFLAFIFSYSLVQAHLVILYIRKKRKEKAQEIPELNRYPLVTIQLPVYNELYVVERLIDCVAKMDYPHDKLQIQILDDSDDETVDLIASKVEIVKAMGIDIEQVIRPDRIGYKAGALAYGMKIAKGEFIAIFDADFLPKAEFLKKTIPLFQDEKVGVVQTKWEHLNQDYSTLTKLQAFGLDAHFTVEQTGRSYAGHFINFNGTAGVWRKSCIEDAGGWQSDTLTEDLDLSYRAQVRGWQFRYLQEVGSPAELPVEMNALKSQQFRWTKGAAETARKNLGKLLGSGDVKIGTKIHGIFHLLNCCVFISILFIAILSIPILFIKHNHPEYKFFYTAASALGVSLLFLATFYFIAFSSNYSSKWSAFKRFVRIFPLFLSVSMGLSLHNALAVFEGFIGKKSPFVRTPKFNVADQGGTWKTNKYLKGSFGLLTVLEGAFSLYALAGLGVAFYLKDFGLFPFHVLATVGFGYVCYYSYKHSKSFNRA